MNLNLNLLLTIVTGFNKTIHVVIILKIAIFALDNSIRPCQLVYQVLYMSCLKYVDYVIIVLSLYYHVFLCVCVYIYIRS